jgi:hypothetical protein
MIGVIALACGALATWLVLDRLLLWRDQRLQQGQAAWDAQFGAGKVFHSTGFEDTVPAAEPVEVAAASPFGARRRSTR